MRRPPCRPATILAMLALGMSGCHPATADRTASLVFAKSARAEVVVRAQAPDEAFDWLWRQLGDMPFFRQNHYDVALPSHALFQRLANDGLAGADMAAAHRVFIAEVYDGRAFAAGRTVLEGRLPELHPELDTFARWSSRWGFATAARYQVVLTLYGPGGSYDSDTATITVLTTPEGAFKKEPLHNLVHEMVHLGIEGPIVRRFGLTHPEKERLVDRICMVAFADRLTGYQPQPMGPPALDPFIDASSLDDLPVAIRRYRDRSQPERDRSWPSSDARTQAPAP